MTKEEANERLGELLKLLSSCDDKKKRVEYASKMINIMLENDIDTLIQIGEDKEAKTLKEYVKKYGKEDAIDKLANLVYEGNAEFVNIKVDKKTILEAIQAYVNGTMTNEQKAIVAAIKNKILNKPDDMEYNKVLFEMIASITLSAMCEIHAEMEKEISFEDLLLTFQGIISGYFSAGMATKLIKSRFEDKDMDYIFNTVTKAADVIYEKIDGDNIEEPFVIAMAFMLVIDRLISNVNIPNIDPRNIADVLQIRKILSKINEFADDEKYFYKSYVDLSDDDKEETPVKENITSDLDDEIMDVKDNESEPTNGSNIKTFSKKDIRKMMRG